MTSAADWFSRYKFCQPLGQGGMGTVYLAEDRSNGNRQCVIKQLTDKYSDPAEHAEAVRLFQREAAILRNLSHPGIVCIFDSYASEDGRYFLVMDYVPGRNLEVMVNTGGPFNSEMAVQIGIQCCEVLEYIHSQNPPVIYRDLKPSNLMLTPDGRIVFIDFGIARSFMPKQVATRVVTAGYSPPEQYFGKPEQRSDLYSLGATISHLVTGQRPKPLALSAPALINARVLPSLDALVRRLTAHNAEDRPPTAMAVRFELYRIYKEIHPEFQVPEEPGIKTKQPEQPEQALEYGREQEADIQSLAKLRADVRERSAQSARSKSISGALRPSDRMRADIEQMSLWARFKQWLEIWLH